MSPATTTTFKEGPEYVLTCFGIKDITGTAYDNDFELSISENWADALTSLSDEWNLENDTWVWRPHQRLEHPDHSCPHTPGRWDLRQAPYPCEYFDPSTPRITAQVGPCNRCPGSPRPDNRHGRTRCAKLLVSGRADQYRGTRKCDFWFQVMVEGSATCRIMNYQITAMVTLTDLNPLGGSLHGGTYAVLHGRLSSLAPSVWWSSRIASPSCCSPM